jgi:hypothetical protein
MVGNNMPGIYTPDGTARVSPEITAEALPTPDAPPVIAVTRAGRVAAEEAVTTRRHELWRALTAASEAINVRLTGFLSAHRLSPPPRQTFRVLVPLEVEAWNATDAQAVARGAVRTRHRAPSRGQDNYVTPPPADAVIIVPPEPTPEEAETPTETEEVAS